MRKFLLLVLLFGISVNAKVAFTCEQIESRKTKILTAFASNKISQERAQKAFEKLRRQALNCSQEDVANLRIDALKAKKGLYGENSPVDLDILHQIDEFFNNLFGGKPKPSKPAPAPATPAPAPTAPPIPGGNQPGTNSGNSTTLPGSGPADTIGLAISVTSLMAEIVVIINSCDYNKLNQFVAKINQYRTDKFINEDMANTIIMILRLAYGAMCSTPPAPAIPAGSQLTPVVSSPVPTMPGPTYSGKIEGLVDSILLAVVSPSCSMFQEGYFSFLKPYGVDFRGNPIQYAIDLIRNDSTLTDIEKEQAIDSLKRKILARVPYFDHKLMKECAAQLNNLEEILSTY